MGIRTHAAKFVSAAGTFALRNVFHRPAANFPGKVALYVDPRIIANSAYKLRCGSICVVGTNGKTTITNMLADCMEAAGCKVVCNRTGANLDSGIATSLLQARDGDWGIFECDELWLAKSLPQLQSTYVLLLNLFRDQLDRVGEVSRIQDSISAALAASPQTVLIYNADDPMCEAIARKVPNPKVPIGIGEDLGLPQNTASDVRICQQCNGAIEYAYRQYGQLGDFHCKDCDFSRPELDFAVRNCRIGDDEMSFDVVSAYVGDSAQKSENSQVIAHIEADYAGAYMVYNLLSTFAAAHLMGASNECIQSAMSAFDPQNGRLQALQVRGRDVLLNLAKNPMGFNQNLDLAAKAKGRKVVAFFVNDMEGDGRDVSWLWDIDFESLADDPSLIVLVGGIRGKELQLRMKYAGMNAELVEDADEAMGLMAKLPADYKLFMIANYTALPPIHARMSQIASEAESAPCVPADADAAEAFAKELCARVRCDAENPLPAIDGPLRIAFALPELLNLCGDAGNAKVLERRCAWRGIPVELVDFECDDSVDLSSVDIVVLAGGPEREQMIACERLQAVKSELSEYIEAGGALLAVGGGFRILGRSWIAAEGPVDGLGLLDVEELEASDGSNRRLGDVVARSSVSDCAVAAFRNDSARMVKGSGLDSFCTVTDGPGSQDADQAVDGALYRSILGSCLHGPLLPKNPEIADWLIERAIERRTGQKALLPALDDSVEFAAKDFIKGRLGAK